MLKERQQQEILTKLKSGEVIIKAGKIIPNPEWIWMQEQERLRKKFQTRREEWKQKQKEEQEEKAWQKERVRREKCLAELFKGGDHM
jgi:hypothetical protein